MLKDTKMSHAAQEARPQKMLQPGLGASPGTQSVCLSLPLSSLDDLFLCLQNPSERNVSMPHLKNLHFKVSDTNIPRS